jgi:hypothetical protein
MKYNSAPLSSGFDDRLKGLGASTKNAGTRAAFMCMFDQRAALAVLRL